MPENEFIVLLTIISFEYSLFKSSEIGMSFSTVKFPAHCIYVTK